MKPTGPIDAAKVRPWATVFRVPVAGGAAWFKACGRIQAHEARLTAALADRWPDRVPEVLAVDADRAWLLTADAGVPVGDLGNPPERWLEILPRYAELQRGEADHVAEHLGAGVPDLRPGMLPELAGSLLDANPPIEPTLAAAARSNLARFADSCAELAAGPVPLSIEHGDLHLRSLFVRDGVLRILDWGDASIGHPFASLVVLFEFLREVNGLPAGDPWFARLGAAYLEPWGRGLEALLDLGLRIGEVAHAVAWRRHRDAMPLGAFPGFDERYPGVVRRAAAVVAEA